VFSVLFIFLLVRVNGIRLRKHKERLEKIVRERTQEIRERKEQVEVAHKEISDSIDYARRIQNALLQSKGYLKEHFTDHFILFKPQARVSGDFYWARERQGYLYLAAVDCTGHGVPGAMMSMLGVSYLNEILSKEELPEPGEILTELRERVVRELSGESPEEGAREGMDAAIVRIELEEQKDRKELLFAGANNPLYVVRKGIAEEDLGGFRNLTGLELSERVMPFRDSRDGIEVKGDSHSVGQDEKEDEGFTTVALSLRKGDMIYLFSDGYADQFGGPRGKKFRYRPFKDLLVEVHQKSAEDQHDTLDHRFEEWKNESEQEQVDDVCVIGVRI
jgi:serine phosphatase RsbU (regulator of sigma subunit)